MTDAEMAMATKARLTELAQRALAMHRTKKMRDYIARVHNTWSRALSRHEFTYAQVDALTLEAWQELDAAAEFLVNERGEDPDSILHWLDMYPSMVMGVHLGAKLPHLV